MEKDKVFAKPIEKRFEFDEEVASVFDDMIARSVPFYKENMALVRDIVVKNVVQKDRVYDLGCSTGSLLIDIAKRSPFSLELIGLDSSEAMLQRAHHKAKAFGVSIDFQKADIISYAYKPAKIFISNYTLQFIRPLKREPLVQKIYDALVDEGIFVFSEKVISADKTLDKQLLDIYFDFKKKQGYSDFEIAQKREALENVLVPYTLEENMEMVKKCGFGFVEPIFRWANFVTFVAIKRKK
ncbi:carboxy-S-adenosyl-L-methionine synthase CmoA [Nitratiruptor sp. SB155-2]|uniref:Carboxy-S-adenosyl-L-methionine synthase n=1 Tax=Nitratiruptor sp. (strain SB155-2) TaxID=387092 RepID=CMOA_NITSB|nr:carboxy-S-adenosyl-L-methionine synthase CmoA [Nitratiruptor sp. SB155-2]A6Q429.1 RecName: Full=Carboxy-S-adenosyl-L-methionine synthase; Short=Cx-SAM synthase [Nitratiruptor sp. SB155-2]BAF70238.1 methyltransferase [Nitratiruptor sp. SB155-2]